MEELTKSQIVLLTLLVSFVTSIATGIVTVALIDQAPPGVTQTVSHIIRETVQSAVPAVITQSAAVAQPEENDPPAEEKPDLPQTIAMADQSIVRLYSDTTVTPIFLGLGLILDAEGTIVTDADALGNLKKASAVQANGSTTPMKIVAERTPEGFLYLAPVSTSSSGHFRGARISSEKAMVGDSVIALVGKSVLRIASGLVVAVPSDLAQEAFVTDFSADSILKGMPIINTEGEFTGMSTRSSRAYEFAAFMPVLPLPSEDGTRARGP